MKKYIFEIIVIVVVVIGITLITISIYDTNIKTNRYCGKVIKSYMTGAGYKVYPTNHVVFYNDVLKRNIDVCVTYQTYANTTIGEIVCFDLSKRDLQK